MHASLLSGKTSFPLTVDGQNPAPFLLILDFALRAPNLILAGRGAMRRSADWPKSCTPRAQPTNIESGAGGRVEVCADAPRARVVQDFVHQPTQELCYTCVGAAGETDLRAHRSHQCVARVLVIAGHMEMRLRRYGARARARGGGGGGGSSVASDVRSGFRALAPALRRLTESHY